MASSEGRAGLGIRKFLEYYLSVILNEGRSTKRKMIKLIEERSSDNRNYRPDGALRVADKELQWAIDMLLEKNHIKTDDNGRSFEISDEGRRALEEKNRIKEQSEGSKEEATQKLISLLDLGPTKKYVLDVGTGEGYLAFKLAEDGFKVLGIDSSELDYSKDSIREATEKIAKKYDIEFRVADVKELTDMDNTFDYVVTSQAVHCMKDQRGCLRSIYRLLKRGGKFVASDFSVGLLGFFVHGFHSFLAVSKEEWNKILTECGYINLKIYEIKDFCVVEAQKPPIKKNHK